MSLRKRRVGPLDSVLEFAYNTNGVVRCEVDAEDQHFLRENTDRLVNVLMDPTQGAVYQATGPPSLADYHTRRPTYSKLEHPRVFAISSTAVEVRTYIARTRRQYVRNVKGALP